MVWWEGEGVGEGIGGCLRLFVLANVMLYGVDATVTRLTTLPFSSLHCRKYAHKITVSVSNPIQFRIGGKNRELHFEADRVARPTFRKSSAHHMLLLWPTGF